MKHIPLIKGRFALVDDSDYSWLSSFRWCYSSDGYAVNYYRDEYGNNRKRSMHRLLMAKMLEQLVPPELQVDHINHTRIDNRRENLRLATRSQNQAYKGLASQQHFWLQRRHLESEPMGSAHPLSRSQALPGPL